MRKLTITLGLVLMSSAVFAQAEINKASVSLGKDNTIVYIYGAPAEKLYNSLQAEEKHSFNLVAEGTLKVKDSVECFQKTRESTEELEVAQYTCMIKLPN